VRPTFANGALKPFVLLFGFEGGDFGVVGKAQIFPAPGTFNFLSHPFPIREAPVTGVGYVQGLGVGFAVPLFAVGQPAARMRSSIVSPALTPQIQGVGRLVSVEWSMDIGFPSVGGREFYSTPFVFLKDTFTGEGLCGRDVGRGHPFSNDVSVCDRNLVKSYENPTHPPHTHILRDVLMPR
jgi:hypothetical protein